MTEENNIAATAGFLVVGPKTRWMYTRTFQVYHAGGGEHSMDVVPGLAQTTVKEKKFTASDSCTVAITRRQSGW